MKRHAVICAVAAAFPCAVPAVYLNPDGLGQALIYPYYTAHSANGNPFNTYISVVNHATDSKVVRVRFREGRSGTEVASFNLFLPPQDVWAAAVVPSADGAAMLTRDASCLDGPFSGDPATGAAKLLEFSNARYAGTGGDGLGDGRDRTREGYVEILEMGVLTGVPADNVFHNSAGFPRSCAAVQGVALLPVTAPTGGLSGTLTLINVASGRDLTVNADALADLASRNYYRAPSDSYPDFNAAEITPVSVIVDGGVSFRSEWNRPVDAVSAAMMRWQWQAEYILDPGTRSNTDIVLTFPTRRHYVTASATSPPFNWLAVQGWRPRCAQRGESFNTWVANREEQHYFMGHPDPSPPNAGELYVDACATANVLSPRTELDRNIDYGLGPDTGASLVLGSVNHDPFPINSTFANGWLQGQLSGPEGGRPLVSLPSSTRILRDGSIVQGAHSMIGLPMTGFSVRTFENGTLTCGSATCQGNYGGAFPLTFTRAIQAN